MPTTKIKIGDVFGKSTVLDNNAGFEMDASNHKRLLMRVKCQCGKEYVVRSQNLIRGEKNKCPKCLNDYRANRKVIPGDIFGKLTVLSFVENNRRNAFCKCECGNTYEIRASSLLTNKTNSCGCIKLCWKGIGDLSGSYMSRVRRQAKLRNLEFKISKEYVWDLFLSQNRKCKLSNLPLDFGKKTTDHNTASLDRIDSSLGYIVGNVQWVHADVNYMKMDLSENRFLQLCSLITKHSKPDEH